MFMWWLWSIHSARTTSRWASKGAGSRGPVTGSAAGGRARSERAGRAAPPHAPFEAVVTRVESRGDLEPQPPVVDAEGTLPEPVPRVEDLRRERAEPAHQPPAPLADHDGTAVAAGLDHVVLGPARRDHEAGEGLLVVSLDAEALGHAIVELHPDEA